MKAWAELDMNGESVDTFNGANCSLALNKAMVAMRHIQRALKIVGVTRAVFTLTSFDPGELQQTQQVHTWTDSEAMYGMTQIAVPTVVGVGIYEKHTNVFKEQE